MTRRRLPWRRRREPGDLTCPMLVELVTAYFEGALDRRDRERFERHLGWCDGCTVYVEQLRVTVEVVGRIEPEHLSPDVERALLDAFRDWKHEA